CDTFRRESKRESAAKLGKNQSVLRVVADRGSTGLDPIRLTRFPDGRFVLTFKLGFAEGNWVSHGAVSTLRGNAAGAFPRFEVPREHRQPACGDFATWKDASASRRPGGSAPRRPGCIQ